MQAAAKILKGKKVAPYLRLIVIPGTPEVYRQCMREGLIDIFMEAGGVVSTPTCGPCLGGYMGLVISSTAKMPFLAPASIAILQMVRRLSIDRYCTPSPTNSIFSWKPAA